jgi:hypothetical protein
VQLLLRLWRVWPEWQVGGSRLVPWGCGPCRGLWRCSSAGGSPVVRTEGGWLSVISGSRGSPGTSSRLPGLEEMRCGRVPEDGQGWVVVSDIVLD